MFALVFTSLLPQATLGDTVCFDVEAGGVDKPTIRLNPGPDNDEYDAETTSKVCAWQEPSSSDSRLDRRCINGVRRMNGRTEFGCISFPAGRFTQDDNFKVSFHGSDALWIDRFSVMGDAKAGERPWKKQWGISDQDGWCMSMNEVDYMQWDDISTLHVPAATCHVMMRFSANGDVEGWHNYPERELLVTGRDNVLYGLATDGTYVGNDGRVLTLANGSPVTVEDGESLLVDFFGRPHVRKADGTIVRHDGTTFTPGARRPSRSSRSIRRLTSEAATPIQALAELVSNAEETDTKHFVLENGDWVQLSQEKAKGMTMIADEADEVLPEVSEDARRRWSRFPLFPGWPSGLKRCRDEMTMPCNMPCHGGWSLLVEMENGCCMNGPGGIDYPKPCGFTTKICQKFYLCWD